MTVSQRTTQAATDASSWVERNSVDIVLAIGAGILIALVLLALKGFGHRLVADRSADRHWRTIVGRVLAKTSLFFILMCAVAIVAQYAGTPPRVLRVINILFVVAAAFQAAVWGRELILGIVRHRVGEDPGQTTLGSAMGLISALVSVAFFAIAVIVILDNLGVNVTGLVAGLGIGGVAIGLAAQGIFKDLFAALAIIFDKPFRVGDTIRFEAITGTVEKIGLKTTRLRSLDGEEVIVSNAMLLDKQVHNFARARQRRVLLTLPLLNRNDPAALGALPDALRQVVATEPGCRFVHAWLVNFTPMTADLELQFRVETDDAERWMAARHSVMLKVLERISALDLQLQGPWPVSADAPPPA